MELANKIEKLDKILLYSEKESAYKFHVNDTEANKSKNFPTNTVTTTKYNILTFLPKALIYQHYRPEKVYFLIIIILENIPFITPVIPISTMVKYCFLLTISMMREAWQDYLRYCYDSELNNEPVLAYRSGMWEEIKTEDLRVGELVLVKRNVRFPADMILIDSDREEGVAFIETSSLDGEVSLKKKFSPKEFVGIINDNSMFRASFRNITGTLKCEEPNSDIFKFNGLFEVQIEGDDKNYEIAVDNSQMLLKGAVLRNNSWAVGMVTYTGHNTKLIKNLNSSSSKESKVFQLMTEFVLIVFIVQEIFCAISAGLNSYYYNTYIYMENYFPKYKFSPSKDSAFVYLSYLIIYYYFIPITVYVTIEFVRMIQAYFLWVNSDLYSHYRQKQLVVRTVSVMEELGAIDYIFTDKTGTLTMNKMEMRYCVIGDNCYEYRHKDPVESNKKLDNDEHGIILMEHRYLENFINLENEVGENNWAFKNSKITNKYNKNLSLYFEKESSLILEYWKALSLAHECVAEEKENGKGFNYVGLSPDDVVLLKAAVCQGVVLQRLDKASARKLKILGIDQEFEILNLFEFSSDRKRLSVIVRDKGIIKMYIKGADSEMKKLIAKDTQLEFLEEATHYSDNFSKSGLRTLFVGMKIIDEQEYLEWIQNVWSNAVKNIEDKNAAIKKAQDIIEKDIYIIGATIVEDKLQDQVPETIQDLQTAGIKIWMITGDKMDTAYNIGMSCNLIGKDVQTFFVRGENGERLSKLQKEFIDFKEINMNEDKLPSYSIIIDSVTISAILEKEETIKTFIDISNEAESVICCRVSPLQKSEIVRIMNKYHPQKTSMAIGDGGNDVSMIMEANIGKFII